MTGKKLVDLSASGNATVDEDLARDGARAARGRGRPPGTIIDLVGNSTQAKLLDRDGEPIQSSGEPDLRLRRRPRREPVQPDAARHGRRWASGPARS